MMEDPKILLIFNPKTIQTKLNEAFKTMEEIYKNKRTQTLNIFEIKDIKSLLDSMKMTDEINIIGGDGTLNRFINSIRGCEVKCLMYFYSSGTGNDFKRDVDTEIDKYGRVLLNNLIENLPRIIINGKESVFINGIGYGIDGFCAEQGEIERSNNKIPNYTMIAIKGMLYAFKPCNADVTVDGVKKHYDYVWLAPTMFGKYYGGGMKICPRQNRKNEERTVTNVCYFGCGLIKSLWIFPKLLEGKGGQYKNYCEERVGKHVIVEFDRPQPLQVDGEVYKDVTRYEVIAGN